MNYVVLVLEPLPHDLTAAAEVVAKGLTISPENVMKLFGRAPGAVTRPVPEREARRIRNIMEAAGLVIEVREGSETGPVVDLTTPTLADVVVGEPEPAPEEQVAPAIAGTQDPSVTDTSERQRAVPQPGHTTATPPRDPTRTTLVRNPPKLERSGLRRRITSAVTMSALLTLIVTLVVIAITVLPLLRQEEQRRVSGVVNAVSATVEGLSGGLPLSAPILRLELDAVQARGAASAWGVDHLLIVDADLTPMIAWYKGQPGLDAFPADLREAELERARVALTANTEAQEAPPTGWLGGLSASGRDLLRVVGLGSTSRTEAAAQLRRLGAVSGAVVAGAEPSALLKFGTALLTALLVGLVPVLFGVLAALSLTRGLRESINYLLIAADRISHGDFELPVELARDDELGQIASAVERMRISLREGMERLRQRR